MNKPVNPSAGQRGNDRAGVGVSVGRVTMTGGGAAIVSVTVAVICAGMVGVVVGVGLAVAETMDGSVVIPCGV